MRYIHLLYVPTMACNMRCRYCYLDGRTGDSDCGHGALETLAFAADRLRAAGVVPFNISLHGGEVTTLSPEVFRELIAWISEYYREHREEIQAAGFRVGSPHIKTNLFRLDRHIDTIRDYRVSVSGSLDLPLSLHDEYRLDKGGNPTLDRILRNVEMMREIPNRKKVSATIFRQHYEQLDRIAEDIRFRHRNTCLDMNDFNFMVGFGNEGGLLSPLTQEEQVDFYRRIRELFRGTELNSGLEGPWFAEFGPDYCTNCDNCGEKFFLLERSGDVYSCVRGQGRPEFYYGNLYGEPVERILARAEEKIRLAHQAWGFDPACARCGYLDLCKTGCPFVKGINRSPKSYTCLLQQALYADHGETPAEEPLASACRYLSVMHPDLAPEYAPPRIPSGVPPLQEIVRADPSLRYIYDPDAFILDVDGQAFPLKSQIRKLDRDCVLVTPLSRVAVEVRREAMEAECRDPDNNALYIQMLSGDMILYGDEGRMKQRHIATEMVYLGALEPSPGRDGFLRADITHLFRRFGPFLSRENANNLFFTTSALRDVHYGKQKNNAFYHMQAMDLPFQNIEFFYLIIDESEAQDHGSHQNL